MGNTIATNTINNSIEQMLTSSASVVQDNKAVASQINSIDIKKGCVFSGNLEQYNYYKVDIKSLQNALISQSTKQKLEATAAQSAETVAQNFDLNPGSKESNNIYNGFKKLSTEIFSNIGQNCFSAIQTVNDFKCAGTVTKEAVIKQGAIVDVLIDCTQKAVIKTEAYQDLHDSISQLAKTVVQNALAMILMMIAVILLIIVGGSVFAVSNLLRNVIILATLLLGLVFLDCYLTKLMCSQKYKLWVIAVALVIYLMVIIAYFYNKTKSKGGNNNNVQMKKTQ
jgi:hypothetical protein